jgi:hypothetical protein
MRLSNARLCLDCDEVHDEARCPMCASESFAFIKRWVTTPDRSARPQSPKDAKEAAPSETLDTYRSLLGVNEEVPTTMGRLLRGGAMGLAVFGVAGWMLQRSLGKKDTDASKPPATPPATPAT